MGQVAVAAEAVAVEAKMRDSWDRNSLSKSGQAGCVEGLSHSSFFPACFFQLGLFRIERLMRAADRRAESRVRSESIYIMRDKLLVSPIQNSVTYKPFKALLCISK